MRLTKIQIDAISAVFRSTVDEVVSEHYAAKTQEHQLTARIGQKLEDRFKGQPLFGARIHVITQDIPDKGPKSLEKKIGTDLYLSMSVEDDFDKALLIQAKWDHSRDPNLLTQAARLDMLCPDGSYIWYYREDGVRAMRAKTFAGNPRQRPTSWSDNLEEVCRKVLSCKRGDRRLAVRPGPNWRGRLLPVLRELELDGAIAMNVTPAT